MKTEEYLIIHLLNERDEFSCGKVGRHTHPIPKKIEDFKRLTTDKEMKKYLCGTCLRKFNKASK